MLKEGKFIPTHDLRKLAEEFEELGDILDDLEDLTKHYFASRYPDATRRFGVIYDRETAERCLGVMRELWERLSGRI